MRIISWLIILLAFWARSEIGPISAQETEPDIVGEEIGDIATVQAADELPAGHSHLGDAFNEGPRQAAYLMGNTGTVHFPISTDAPEAQAFFDQGIGQTHGFWYFEAERSFRQAAAIDPDHPMTYWGMALANLFNDADRARGFIETAVEKAEADGVSLTERERMYLDGLSAFLQSDEPRKERRKAYVASLEAIVESYPDDIEAKAFLAVRQWQYKGDLELKTTEDYEAVDAMLESVFDVKPMHPAHHYRIHLWDYKDPAVALGSAARCGQSAPGIAHMWHMPNHIFSRLKRYPDAVWQQEASSRVDHSQMIRDQILPDQITNYAHNQEWTIRNLIHIGRWQTALALAKNLIELPRHPRHNTYAMRGRSASYGRDRLILTLERFELWQDILNLSATEYLEPTELTNKQDQRLRIMGVAHFGLGQATPLNAIVDQFRARRDAKQAELDQLESHADEEPDTSVTKPIKRTIRNLDRHLKELEVYQALLSENPPDPSMLSETIRDLSTLSKSRRAQLLLRAGDTESALEEARNAVDEDENEVIPLAVLVDILQQTGNVDEAVEQFEALREISSEIEALDAPPFARLASLAESRGWPTDWRRSRTVPDDVGERPELDALGPMFWSPPRAPDWSLPNAEGEPIGLDAYRGRPVIVIFYLGFGCIHCIQQLITFAPETEAFREMGVDLIAISTDPVEKVRNAEESYRDGVFPFPLVSDAGLDVFRAYRAHDDFEGQPLHGTFLIDGDGRILWHDISYEPFEDVAFLLGETRRLLGLAQTDRVAIGERPVRAAQDDE